MTFRGERPRQGRPFGQPQRLGAPVRGDFGREKQRFRVARRNLEAGGQRVPQLLPGLAETGAGRREERIA